MSRIVHSSNVHLSQGVTGCPGVFRRVALMALTSLLSGSVVLVGTSASAAQVNWAESSTIQLAQGLFPVRLPPAIAQRVLRDVAQRTGVPVGQVRIVRATQKTFPNSCVFNFGEICNEIYQPIAGWEVITSANGQPWTYHVSQQGQIVANPRGATGNPSNPMPGAYVDAVIMHAARRANVSPASVRVLQTTPKTFSNPCIFNFGEVCTREYRPIEGYEMTVQVQGQTWLYHVSRDGSQVALDPKVAGGSQLPSAIENVILQNARSWTNASNVRIVSAKAQTWSNSCAFSFGKICPMIYQPVEGWEVAVSAGNLEWTYHTTRDGRQVLMDRRANMPSQAVNAILQAIQRRFGPSVSPNSLRFLEVKEQSRRICSLFGGCRTEPVYLTVVSNGRQQWGYQSDSQGRQVLPISVAQVRQATDGDVNR